MDWLTSCIAGDDGRWRFGIDHRPLWYDQMKGFQAPLIHGDIAANQRPEDIENDGTADRQRRIIVELALRRGAGEINGCGTAGFVDTDFHFDFGAHRPSDS